MWNELSFCLFLGLVLKVGLLIAHTYLGGIHTWYYCHCTLICCSCCPRTSSLYAGHFLAASEFLCSNCHLKHPQSHAILLRYLADSKKIQTAISHLKQVVAVSPSLLQEISSEILALLSSSSNQEPMLLLLQEMQQDEYISTNNSWRDFCVPFLSWVSGVTHSLQPPRQDTTLGILG